MLQVSNFIVNNTVTCLPVNIEKSRFQIFTVANLQLMQLSGIF